MPLVERFLGGLSEAAAGIEKGFATGKSSPMNWSGWFGALSKSKGLGEYLEPTAQFLGSGAGWGSAARWGVVGGGTLLAANTALNVGSNVWRAVMPPYGFMQSNRPINPVM